MDSQTWGGCDHRRDGGLPHPRDPSSLNAGSQAELEQLDIEGNTRDSGTSQRRREGPRGCLRCRSSKTVDSDECAIEEKRALFAPFLRSYHGNYSLPNLTRLIIYGLFFNVSVTYAYALAAPGFWFAGHQGVTARKAVPRGVVGGLAPCQSRGAESLLGSGAKPQKFSKFFIDFSLKIKLKLH